MKTFIVQPKNNPISFRVRAETFYSAAYKAAEELNQQDEIVLPMRLTGNKEEEGYWVGVMEAQEGMERVGAEFYINEVVY